MHCILNRKQADLIDLLHQREIWRQESRRVVFTNGCFDILHIGHIRLLSKAKSLGDVLIVGLNSDTSVRGLKGPNRPVQSEQARMEILSALRDVDAVVIFDDPTPIPLIEKIKPEVHVKGGDYQAEELPEYPIVTRYGGRVHIVEFVKDQSSSRIISKLNGKGR